jgi:shikimate kinase
VLAKRLNWEFLDSDTIVEERAGMTIREIFAQGGETLFRKLETETVQDCCKHDKAVIATGGGAILNPENVAALRNDGFVVHLTADPSELWHRISRDCKTAEQRPKLVSDAGSGLDELKKLLRSRSAAYASARHVEVSVEGRSPDEVTEAVMLLMKAHGVSATKA